MGMEKKNEHGVEMSTGRTALRSDRHCYSTLAVEREPLKSQHLLVPPQDI